ncbi:MAG TPA: ABC transporter permease [Gemmatimonadales bacterium]|jgi:putative ABC transport system permease protein
MAGLMGSLLSDFRYAARRLRHSPAFTLIVVLTLALGIGANSAIFSVVNTVLLVPMPYRDPSRLVTIYHHYPSIKLEAPVSAPGFHDYRDRTHSFSGVGVEAAWSVNLTGVGDPQRLVGGRASGLFFPTLGVTPAMGRVISNDDDQAGHNQVVVLSHGLWLRDFGARPDVVGQPVQLNGVAYQVIGVMPREFIDPFNPKVEIWTPVAIDPAQFVPSNYTSEYLNLIARLKPGTTLDGARREMAAFATRLKKDNPTNFSPDWTLEVRTMSDVQTGAIRPALLILLGAVGFVLLIACGNVANLMLARAATRQREVAVRAALGATRWHLMRQLLAESLLLSLSGGVLGLAIAFGSVKALIASNPGRLPRVGDLAIDSHVVAFTLVIAIATGILFGLAPALRAWHTDLQPSLKDGARGGTADRSGQRIRRALVIAEIALALMLLAGGGLLIRSFARLAGVSPGFQPDHLLTFAIGLPPAKYKNDTVQTAFWSALMPRLEQVPGVVAAAGTTVVPFGGNWSTGSFNVEGYTPPQGSNGPWGDIRTVSPDFFTAMRIPRHAGRTFTAHDDDHAVPVAVVDDQFVKRFYPAGVDPIGKRIYFGSSTPDSTTKYITIVGVVGHAAHEGLDADLRIQLYLSLLQPSTTGGGVARLDIVVRTAGDPLAATGAIRAALRDLDPELPMARVTTLDELMSASMGQRRLSTILLAVFAGLALLLASLGIYGVMSFTVAQRTREFGLRVALGASRENVIGLVLHQGIVLAGAGTLIGLAGAFGLTRLIASQLYGVRATDPETFAAVTVLLAVVALGATVIPAWRATRIDPLVALRDE